MTVVRETERETQTSFAASYKMKVTALRDSEFYRASDNMAIKNALEELGIYAPTIKRIEIMHKVCEKNPPILYELEGYYYQDAMWTLITYDEGNDWWSESEVKIPSKYDGELSIEFDGLRVELEFIEFKKNDETDGCEPY